MITILGLVLIVGGVISIAKGIRWLADLAPYPQEAAEAPDAEQLAKAMLTPDCPSIVAGSDIDAAQWAAIVQQLPELAEIDADKLSAFYLIPEQP